MIWNISKWISLLFWVTIIVGCTQSAQNATSPSPAIPTLLANSVRSTDTITPTLTLIATDTPTPSNTPTVLPTLSPDDAINRLLDLLANNGDCRLPCLWGIAPGKSTPQEAQAILLPLDSIRSSYSLPAIFDLAEGFVHPVYAEENLMLSVQTEYLSDNQIVNHLRFYAKEYQLAKASNGEVVSFSFFDSETFGKRVDYYSLSHLLSEQGIPDAVMIATSGEPTYASAGGFEIVLLYPTQGIWVRYTTQLDYLENSAKVQGCPNNAHVEMELFPPGNAGSFSAALEQNQDWVAQKNWFQPLEKVTSMSLKQFYETFRQPTDKCIETPANL
jgi:hypothetical protein